MQPYRKRVGTCRYIADKLLDLLGICADANVIIEVAEEKRPGERPRPRPVNRKVNDGQDSAHALGRAYTLGWGTADKYFIVL
jgi:hypothetical protein